MATGPKVGTAYVDVAGDFSSFYRDVDRQLAPISRKFRSVGDDSGKQFSRGLDRSRDSTRGTSKDVDQLTDRLNLLGGSLRGGGKNMGLFGRQLSLVRPAALITGLGVAAQGLSAAGGAAVAVTAALAPLSGVAAAAGVGLTAAAQGAGTFALAAWGVADAVKEQLAGTASAASGATSSASAQRAAARAVETAHDGVRSALEAVKPAMQAVADAEKGLSASRVEARRHLIDLRDAVIDTTFAEQAAGSALTDARAALAALVPTARQVADAHETVTDSLRGEEHAALSLIDAQQTLADLLKGPDPLDLADAHDAVTDSLRDEERAQLDLAAEQKKAAKVLDDPKASEEAKARARLDLADAENRVEDAKRATAHAQQRLNDLETKPDPHEIAKARLAVGDAENGVADAKRDSADAQAALSALEAGPSAEDLARARRDVAEAELAVARAKREHARAVRELTAAEKKGIERSDEVVAARRDLADAEHGLVEAHRQVTKAERDLADAQASAAESATQAGAAAAKLNQKLAALPESAQAFVRTLISLKPKLDELRATAADGIFPGATAGLTSAVKNFGPLKKVIGETAGVIGDLVAKAGALVGSKAFGSDLERIGGRNAKIIGTAGDAALHFATAIRHILVAAGPLTSWLADVTLRWGKSTEAAAAAGRENGKLAGFFEKTRAVLERLGSIVSHLAGAFFEVGKAAAPLGNEILAAIDRAAGRFEEWTKSAEGGNALAKYFDDIKPAIFEVGRLIHDVTNTFFRLGAGDQVAPLLKSIRTDLLPVFEKVVESTTTAFGPHLINLLTQVLRLFGSIAGSSGPLTAYVDLLAGAAGALANLLAGNPGLQSMAISFLGILTIFKALKFASAISGATAFGSALIGVGTAYKSLAAGQTVATVAQERGIAVTITARLAALASAAATRIWAAATAAHNAVMAANIGLITTVAFVALRARVAAIAAAVATRVWTAAQWLLNVALDANPIGLVVIAIAGLVAALVIAWQHSEKFREIVTAAWNAIKRTTDAVWGAISAAVTAYVRAIKAVITTYFEAYVAIVLGAWRAIRDTGRAIWDGIVASLAAVWAALRGSAALAWDAIRLAIVTPFREARNIIQDVVRTLVGWLGDRWKDILEGAGKLRDGFVGAFDKIADSVHSVWSWLKKVSSLVGDVIDAIGKIKLPHIKVPDLNPFNGGEGGGNVGPTAPLTGGVDQFNPIAKGFGLTMTSAYRPGDPGWHGKNRARDYSNGTDTPQELAFAKYMAASYGKRLLELIHTPLGYGIKNGAKVPLSFWGSAVNAAHHNHVHVAYRMGGKSVMPEFARVGEDAPRWPEYHIATNPAYRGQNIALMQQAASDLNFAPAGGGAPQVRVFIGDRELTDIVRVEVDESDRRKGAAYMAGVN